MSVITLLEVTPANWRECVQLQVLENQVGFVAPNTMSLLQAKFEPMFVPMAIYADQTMVGFTMYDVDVQDGTGYLTRLMIDHRYQRKGYGRAATQQVIDRLKAHPQCTRIETSYKIDNIVAARLYKSIGFEETGGIDASEIIVEISQDKLNSS